MSTPNRTPSSTPSSSRRPSLIPKQTHVRLQKHLDTQKSKNHPKPLAPLTLDTLIVGLGYASLASYLYQNAKRFSPFELASISAASLTIGYAAFDLGPRRAAALSDAAKDKLQQEIADADPYSESWKSQFRSRSFDDLHTPQKIAYLRVEERKIREMQEDEQLRCGQAYIAKEQAYIAYEKHGGYGGVDWKKYAEADGVCKEVYRIYQEQQKRLSELRVEIEGLLAQG